MKGRSTTMCDWQGYVTGQAILLARLRDWHGYVTGQVVYFISLTVRLARLFVSVTLSLVSLG